MVRQDRRDSHVHYWFGLTYAQYLVLNRTMLQSMPIAWQAQFVNMLRSLAENFDPKLFPGYRVQPVDKQGRFMKDPLPHYKHAPLLKMKRRR